MPRHSPNTPPTEGFRCPICDLVGDPEKMVEDARWADPAHPECVARLLRWPMRATDPRGPQGTDEYRWWDA